MSSAPRNGGPYILKPRFFGSEQAFVDAAGRSGHAAQDGVFVARPPHPDTVLGRFRGQSFRVEWTEETVAFSGPGFNVRFAASDPEETLEGRVHPGASVDLTYFRILDWLRRGVLDDGRVNYVNT